jgi:L-asparaginase
MRTSGDSQWDGPGNLLDAASVAADHASEGRGVMVVFAGKVFAGQTAVKFHATAPDAFTAPHTGPIGRVEQGRVAYKMGHAAVSQPGHMGAAPSRLQPPRLSAQVALIPVVLGDDGRLLDLVRPTHDGVVIMAFGSGNVPPGAVPAIGRWIDEGKPVVVASRCPTGLVTPLYAFDGGGSRLVAMGAIPAGPRSPSQARMELTIALSAGVAYGS